MLFSRCWLAACGLLGARLLLCLALLSLGCGGASGAAGSGGGTVSGGDDGAQDNRTQGGRRMAGEGAACDHGGQAERTCQVDLYCCYGPPDDPGELGRCMGECPEY